MYRLLLIFVSQKAARNAEDVAELKKYFSDLVTMLQGPLQSAEACPPVLRQRIEAVSG